MQVFDLECGSRLRLVRTQLKLTTYGMAERLQLPQSTYSKYENGSMSIKVEALKQLYLQFKVLPDYICLGKFPIFEGKKEAGHLITDLNELKAGQQAIKSKLDFWISRK
jgi:transcriptional regulator with XRE-family HTH domain